MRESEISILNVGLLSSRQAIHPFVDIYCGIIIQFKWEVGGGVSVILCVAAYNFGLNCFVL